MNVPLNWIPAGGSSSLSQDVQNRVKGDSTWITVTSPSLAPTVNNYTVTDVPDNVIYEFRIINNCSIGGPIGSVVVEKVNIICPIVTLSATVNSVTVSFPHLGGSINSYTVSLYDATTSFITSHVINTGLSGTISYTFSTGISQNTTYKVLVSPAAGSVTKTTCPLSTVTTPFEECLAPTNVTATII